MAGERRTLREEARISVDEMASQEPTVTKFVVSFDQFDSVSFGKTELVRASGQEIICKGKA